MRVAWGVSRDLRQSRRKRTERVPRYHYVTGLRLIGLQGPANLLTGSLSGWNVSHRTVQVMVSMNDKVALLLLGLAFDLRPVRV